ncbi:MAG: hypothetical protein KAG95_06645 [Bacteroidales bacterium]|nr:hypothetical protein [Bacteroidales bacterium]
MADYNHNKKIFISILLLFLGYFSFGQDENPKYDFNGYITNMQSVMFQDVGGDWVNDNLLHNRLNFCWYPTDAITASIQIRNRFFTGETLKYTTDYDKQLEKDNGYFGLTANIINKKSCIFNSTVDRLWLKYSSGNFEATIGRQRLNWGQTFVWNPNDIFNAYSFFDFDYIEHPGSDAVRLQYYTGVASSIELAAKLNCDTKTTAAALYKFNMFSYDFQFLTGILDDTVYVIGAGWSGNLGDAGFRGEISYFVPQDNVNDSKQFMSSVGLDYTFKNSLMLQAEFLFTDNTDNINFTDFEQYYSQTLNVRSLAFTKYTFFSQITYPITPLLNATLSGMYFPKLKGYYAGLSLSYSLKNNLDFSAFVQYFNAELINNTTTQTERQKFTMAFLKMKLNF